MRSEKIIQSVKIDGSRLDIPARRIKASKVEAEMLTILQSNLFRKKVLDADYTYWMTGETVKSKFRGLLPSAIYFTIMLGIEEWNQDKDYEADLFVDDYFSFRRVIGYMNPGKKTIWVNTKYFDSATRMEVGSNFLHEWIHTLGSRHGGSNYRMSLAYLMNEIYEQCYIHFFIEGKRDIDWRYSTPVEVPPLPETKPFRIVCERVWWKLWLGKVCYKVRDV